MSEIKVNSIKGVAASSAAITISNTDGTCTANITNNLSNRNLIINGDMKIAQRGTSSTGQGYQTVDRYFIGYSGTDEAPEQEQGAVASGTTPYTLGFRKTLKITNGNQTSGAGAGDYIFINHFIEAQNLAQSGWNYVSSSSNITLSFWVKSSVAQNFYFQFASRDGSQYSYPMETGSLTADTWTKVTKTISGNSNIQVDNDNGAGAVLTFGVFWGTNLTGSVSLNSWMAKDDANKTPDNPTGWYTTNDATFEITGVQLEVSDHATDFEHLSFADQLRRCQRYYQVLADGGELATELIGVGMGWHSSQAEYTIRFLQEMRAAPSLVQSSGTNYYQWRTETQSKNFSSLSFDNATKRSALIYVSGTSGLTQGYAYRVQLGNSSAYLHLSSEL